MTALRLKLGRVALAGLVVLIGVSCAALADMYPDASNAKLPAARSNLSVPAHVATNAALAAASTASYPSGVWRDDYAAGIGAEPLWFLPESGTCAANSRVNDGGSCVNSSGGNSFIAVFDTAGASVLEWGPPGDGSTDATAQLTAAFAWADTSGIPLLFDDVHKFLLSTGLASTGTPDVRGSSHVGLNTSTCPGGGLIVNSNITAASFTGHGGSMTDMCIQMATTQGVRGSGAGILVGSGSSYQQQFRLSGNAVLNPYDGILIGGTGTLQTNTDTVENNVVSNPSHYGIAHGLNSTGANTVGTIIRNNQIGCGLEPGNTATGMAIFDGALSVDNGDSGPFACKYGTQILPGAAQNVGAAFTGVLGDSSITHDLWVHPTDATGSPYYLAFNGTWTGAISSGDQSVLIENGPTVHPLNAKFVGHTFYSNSAGGSPLVKINATGVTIADSQFVADGFALGTSLELGALSNMTTITNNQFQILNSGTITNGITIDNGASIFSITGNTILATNPIVYTPAFESATIANNLGVDNVCVTVASGTSIAIPNAASCIDITGSTAVTDIVNSRWSTRSLTVRSHNGVALNTGGSATTNFCSPVTLSAGQMVRVQYDTIGTCWAPLAGGIIFPARILTFYVATTGSDSNNCLSASTACLTLQHAFGVAMTYDAGNSSIVISLGAGTFDGGYFSGVIRGNAGTGISGQYLFIQGAGPTTIVTNTGGRVATLGFSNGMAVELVNLKVNALSGTYGVFAQNPGTVVELGAGLTLTGQTGAVAALHGEAYALIEMASVGNTLTITGDFTQLATLGASGYLEFDPAGTGTIACSGLTIHNQLFDLSDLANMLLPAGWAFSGCPSGSQSYLVERGAVLTNLTGSPIPGTAGANINGGQYCSPTCTIGTGGQLVGTKTNDAAAPGNIGELISNVARDTTATVTITNASPAVITWTTNNFSTTQTTPVQFTTTGTLPSPLAIGTTYWTIPSSVTANTFQLATTVANAYVGTAINTTTNGGPTHTGINAAFLASAVPSDISGLQLTAGDWDCNGTAVFLPAGTTTVNGIGGDIATSPGQLNAADQGSHFLQAVFTTGNEQIMPYGTARFSLAATTVIHFSGYASFGISTLSAFGAQRCRRMR